MNIAKLRRYIGFSQQNMADHLDISLTSYWNKEKGRTPFTDVEKEVVKKLFLEYFPEITIGYIFFNEIVPKVESEVNL